jgi:hypothetical protein
LRFDIKKKEIVIDGEKDNMAVINWYTISEKMNDDYNDILEYFVNDEDCEEKIAAWELKPFGLFGLMHTP